MKQHLLVFLLTVGWLFINHTPVRGDWVITFPDTTVRPNATVNYSIYGEWDDSLGTIAVPMVVRSIDSGAFWSGTLPVDTIRGAPVNVEWNWANPGWAEIVQQFHPAVSEAPFCPTDGDVGYDRVSPDHFAFYALGMTKGDPPVPEGRHFLTITFDVTGTPGRFEFDTACYSQHITSIYFLNTGWPWVDHGCTDDGLCDMVFNKGTITIAETCDCSALGDCNESGGIDPPDVVYLIAYALQNGPPPPTDENCPAVNRGDWDCDDRINLRDIVSSVNYVYRYPAPGPCDPCNAWENFIYPLQIGNRWDYSGKMVFYNFQPDSLSDLFPDTFYSISNVEITRMDTLRDTLETYVFHETLAQDDFEVFHTENYFNNLGDGFYNFAHYGVNAVITPLKPGHQSLVYFKDRYFNSVQEIFDWVKTGIESPARLVDSLEYENPPLRCLAYPLAVGARWTYRYPGNPWHMEKAVIGRADQTVPAGDFDCLEIEYFYDLNDDGVWDHDIDIVDQISHIGLVKRSITIRGVVLPDPWSPEPLGYFDAQEEFVLTDYLQ